MDPRPPPPEGRRCRLPTLDELARYAKPGHSCRGSGIVTVQPRGGEQVTLACRCAAKRMVKSHPGAFFAPGNGGLFVDLDLEAAELAAAQVPDGEVCHGQCGSTGGPHVHGGPAEVAS